MAKNESSLDLIDFVSDSHSSSADLITPYQSQEQRTVPNDRLRKFEEFIEDPIDGEIRPKYWSVEFFRPFFDVTTDVILHRLSRVLHPLSAWNFFEGDQPDLYAPFWLCTTLICVLTVSANAASYLSLGAVHFSANLSILANCSVLVYGLMLAVPLGVYCVFKGENAEIRYLSVLSLYGYSYFVFIPAVALAALSRIIQWPVMISASIWAFLLLKTNLLMEFSAKPMKQQYFVAGLLAIGYLLFVFIVNLDYLLVKKPNIEGEK